MASYSTSDKFLHKFYLSNYGISKATLEMEEIMYGAKAKELDVKQYVFVSGLARSGTTAVMNKIFGTDEFASLQYSNMPFLLSPNLWKRKSKIESHERAHNDGIIIDGNSPEEFDEYFWKAFSKDSYIEKEGLEPHEVKNDVLDKYLTYVSLICLAKGKDKYISKNNNNVLRLSALDKIKGHKTIILFRNPIAHAASLMKLDKSFSQNQKEDPFALDYFNYLGHHEFGLNHKPFLLTPDFAEHREQFAKDSINYWLAIWLNYYSYVLNRRELEIILICFEDLIQSPDLVYDYIFKELDIEYELVPVKKHNPSSYPTFDCDEDLLNECKEVYGKLSTLKKYEV
jgi:hypothetical protein